MINMRIATIWLTLRVTRSKWWQSVLKDPGHHKVLMASMRGLMQGQVRKKVEWMQQLVEDVKSLIKTSGKQEVQKEIVKKFMTRTNLEVSTTRGECADTFLKLDPKRTSAGVLQRHCFQGAKF